ncbi:MAG: hypothetical protein EXS05_13710 [Planctomycetaceae bacterium]|nr:hypothetical protein [Planctomycetaceae bacterium]
MPLCATSSSTLRRFDKSLLSAAHLCLQQNLEANRQTTAESENQFQAWRASWNERTENLALRLTRIDSRLVALSDARPSRPVLSLVGSTPSGADADDCSAAF